MSGAPALEDILATVRSFQPRAREAGVELIGLVGSIARGDARPDSDVDIVFDACDDLDYWRLGGLQMDLQDAVGRRVDLVDRLMMKPERWSYMAENFVPL